MAARCEACRLGLRVYHEVVGHPPEDHQASATSASKKPDGRAWTITNGRTGYNRNYQSK